MRNNIAALYSGVNSFAMRPNSYHQPMDRQKRLRQLIDDKFEGKQADFARAIKRSPAQVHQWLAGHRRLGDAGVMHIEKTLRLSGWFDGESNVTSGPNLRGSVPLISWVQAGDYAEAVDNLSTGEGERIETTVPVRAHTYALRVTGDSMEPEFPEGCIIIVEPDMEPHHGDHIIVKNGENEATFKQLIQDGADWYLKPINPRYPVKPLPKGAVFCGVVRGMERRFR